MSVQCDPRLRHIERAQDLLDCIYCMICTWSQSWCDKTYAKFLFRTFEDFLLMAPLHSSLLAGIYSPPGSALVLISKPLLKTVASNQLAYNEAS